MAWVWFALTDLILYIPCLLFLYYLYNNFLDSHRPVNWPIVGMLPSLLVNVNKIHDRISNILVDGNLYWRGPWFSGMVFFVTSDPENVHHIFTKNFQNYRKGDDYIEMFEILGNGIFNTDGSLSMDLPVVPFARAVDDTSTALFSRLSSPAALWKLLKLLGIGQEKKLAKARVVGDRFIIEAIEKRKQEMNEGKHICPDMLSSYLSDEDVPNSNNFLRDNLNSFLTAGRDTTSSGLCWFFWALSQNKQTEEKILCELCSAPHNITPESLITFDPEELEKLVYFKAAFMESLRLSTNLS
ncbi:Cytochrome P450 86B1 [Carex littledalei]|uniref:Cytochrome P450 86B1 n=1 Tax=Carex littledalei TaxID=544730 RepID=A0A833UYK2_9POAL|nr:Cytochrome P450 86B1 [Carex littledalei]